VGEGNSPIDLATKTLMKHVYSSRAIAILVLGTWLVTAANATTYLVGISPNHTRTDAQTVLQCILLFVLEGAAPGDRLAIYDAFDQALVTSITIPAEGLFTNNPRARAQRLKTEMATLQQFLKAERSFPTEMTEVVRLPQFLDLVGTQLRSGNEHTQVILIASPFFMNSEDPAFNMNDAYPSDANLTADQRQSVWGTALRQGSLTNVTVHYAYLRPCFVNDFHQERTGRFLSLYIRLQNGVLATFAPDVTLAFQRSKENVRQPFVDAQLDPNDTKLEMRHISPRSIPVWFGPTNQQASRMSDTNARPVSPPPVSFPVAPLANKVGIGIKWAAAVDCDLYVKASPTSKELSFRNVKSKEGRYFHDYRSGNIAEDFEFVELDAPVEFRNVTAYVNLFAGKAPSIRGTVVVYYDGKSHFGEFQLAATAGNNGGDMDSRSSSPYWTKLDLLQIVGAPDTGPPGNSNR